MAKKKSKIGRPKGAKDKKKRKYGSGTVRIYNDAFIQSMASKLVPWFNAKKKKKRYWLRDFAIEHGFPSNRMAEWAEKSKYFAQEYALAKDIQESRLVHGGIEDKMNARMVKLALQNVAGWRDAQDMNITGDLIFNIKKNYGKTKHSD